VIKTLVWNTSCLSSKSTFQSNWLHENLWCVFFGVFAFCFLPLSGFPSIGLVYSYRSLSLSFPALISCSVLRNQLFTFFGCFGSVLTAARAANELRLCQDLLEVTYFAAQHSPFSSSNGSGFLAVHRKLETSDNKTTQTDLHATRKEKTACLVPETSKFGVGKGRPLSLPQ
jgi:hypothetical protein